MDDEQLIGLIVPSKESSVTLKLHAQPFAQ
jgi:hypothetical protein